MGKVRYLGLGRNNCHLQVVAAAMNMKRARALIAAAWAAARGGVCPEQAKGQQMSGWERWKSRADEVCAAGVASRRGQNAAIAPPPKLCEALHPLFCEFYVDFLGGETIETIHIVSKPRAIKQSISDPESRKNIRIDHFARNYPCKKTDDSIRNHSTGPAARRSSFIEMG